MWYHCNVAAVPDKNFINAGIWVSCLLFLAVALLAAVLTAVFAVINTTTNPVEPIAGVFGLYVWNGIAGSVNSRHHTRPLTALSWDILHMHHSLCHNDWMTSHYSVKCHLFSTGVSLFCSTISNYTDAAVPSWYEFKILLWHKYGSCLSNHSQTATSTSLCLFSQQCSQLLLQECFVCFALCLITCQETDCCHGWIFKLVPRWGKCCDMLWDFVEK